MELAKAKGEVPVNKISFTSNNKLVTIVKKSTGVGLAISQLLADYLKKTLYFRIHGSCDTGQRIH